MGLPRLLISLTMRMIVFLYNINACMCTGISMPICKTYLPAFSSNKSLQNRIDDKNKVFAVHL